MTLVDINITIDEKLKEEFDSLCSELGLNPSTIISSRIKRFIEEKKFPFELKENDKDYITRQKALECNKQLRLEAIKNGTADMSLEEINEEIDKVRKGL